MTAAAVVTAPTWSVVVPTLGRPSLTGLLISLASQAIQPDGVVVVDDRPRPSGPLDVSAHPAAHVVGGGGFGPAHARNAGWRAGGTTSDTDEDSDTPEGAVSANATEWVVFLDDDVVLTPDWSSDLVEELSNAAPGVAGIQADLHVPLPADRRPTDWERGTAGLEQSVWITADMAYRRRVLEQVHGFDERFPRAFREDADLGLRVLQAGYRLQHGRREVTHPVRPAGRWASLHQQRGNADDALMRRLHGRRWHELVQAPGGRLPWHVATTAALAVAATALVTRRWRPAAVATTTWAALTTDFAVRRIAPGPRDGAEVRAMALTSVVIPLAAVRHRLAGTWRHRHAEPWPSPARAVLLDRDGTLIHDVPYNGDPDLVRPVEGASKAVDRLRRAGFAVGVVTNQSAVGRGMLSYQQVAAVNERVDDLLGPFATWQVCPHAPDDGCACRKPAPGLVHAAANQLGVRPHEVVVIGDIGADVLAARAAGASCVLVPTPQTRHEEIAAAPLRARSLDEAVDLVISGRGAMEGRR